MNIEVTDACNIRCSSCLSPHGSNFMSPMDFEKILLKIPRKEKRRVALHWRGEPCLHPQLPEIAELCRLEGAKAWLSTNTSVPLLSNKKYVEKLLNNLNRIEVCVDGYDQESLSRYRVGADWSLLMKNLDTMGWVDTTCRKDMRVLMFRYNEPHQAFFRKLARRYDFDRLRFANPIIDYKTRLTQKEADQWLADNARYQRYRKEGKHWVLKKSDTCIPHVCVSVHGSAHPCGHDWRLEHTLGNLLTDSWETVEQNLSNLTPRMMRQELSICDRWCCLTKERAVSWQKI